MRYPTNLKKVISKKMDGDDDEYLDRIDKYINKKLKDGWVLLDYTQYCHDTKYIYFNIVMGILKDETDSTL